MKTRSKYIFFICVALAALLAAGMLFFSSCASDRTDDVTPTAAVGPGSKTTDISGTGRPLLCDWSESDEHINAQIEYEGWNAYNQYTDESQPRTTTVKLYGQDVTGNYSYTFTGPLGVPCNEYDIVGWDGSFETDKDGNVVGYYGAVDEEGTLEGRDFDWKEVARSVVTEFGRGVDPDDYEFNCEDASSISIKYVVTFTRKIRDIGSYDAGTVGIRVDGSIEYFSTALLGCLSGVEVPEINVADIEKAVMDRCGEMTADANDYYDEFSYDKTEYKVALDANGRPVIETTVTLSFSKTEDDGSVSKGGERLVFISDTEGKAP